LVLNLASVAVFSYALVEHCHPTTLTMEECVGAIYWHSNQVSIATDAQVVSLSCFMQDWFIAPIWFTISGSLVLHDPEG